MRHHDLRRRSRGSALRRLSRFSTNETPAVWGGPVNPVPPITTMNVDRPLRMILIIVRCRRRVFACSLESGCRGAAFADSLLTPVIPY